MQPVPTVSLLGSLFFPVGGLKSFKLSLLELETDTCSNTKLGTNQERGLYSKATLFILIVMGVICIHLCKGLELG